MIALTSFIRDSVTPLRFHNNPLDQRIPLGFESDLTDQHLLRS